MEIREVKKQEKILTFAVIKYGSCFTFEKGASTQVYMKVQVCGLRAASAIRLSDGQSYPSGEIEEVTPVNGYFTEIKD